MVLANQISLPELNRPWALPVLCALYRSAEENQQRGHRHNSPRDLMRQLRCVLLRWFQRRKFVFAGDSGFGTHAAARFEMGQPQLTLISKLYKGAYLYDPRPKRKPGTNGRPRVKGRKRRSPEGDVARAKSRQRLEVSWNGGGRRDVAVLTGTA